MYETDSISLIHSFTVTTTRMFWESAICNDFTVIIEKTSPSTEEIEHVFKQQHCNKVYHSQNDCKNVQYLLENQLLLSR
jgi:hypothetical protein